MSSGALVATKCVPMSPLVVCSAFVLVCDVAQVVRVWAIHRLPRFHAASNHAIGAVAVCDLVEQQGRPPGHCQPCAAVRSVRLCQSCLAL